MSEKSASNGLVVFLVCWFVGFLGIHRFMVGKMGTGVLYLLTGGIFGIGWMVDFFMILFGSFKDKDGKVVKLGS